MTNFTTMGTTTEEVLFDFVSLFPYHELRDAQNETVKSLSFDARKNGKFPIFYLYNEVI
jgi:hypothetical protein